MLEYDRLFKAVIYGLIDCLRSKLSDLTCSITNICKKKKIQKLCFLFTVENSMTQINLFNSQF